MTTNFSDFTRKHNLAARGQIFNARNVHQKINFKDDNRDWDQKFNQNIGWGSDNKKLK